MLRTAKYNPEFLRALGGRKFRHPETGNQVQFQSLPAQEQKKVYQQWSARQQQQRQPSKPKEDPKQKADVDRRVDEFFESEGRGGRGIPEDPTAAFQLMQLRGLVSQKDRSFYPHILDRIYDRIDEDAAKDEEREKNRPWWKRMMDIDASQKVAARWLHGMMAPQIRAARTAPKFTKLYIFDFDGTTFRSPSPGDDYENKEAWWSDPASLSPPVVDQAPDNDMWYRETVDAIRAATAEPDSYVVVMTGRNNLLQDRIQEILDSKGLKPDELITNPRIGDTTGFKKQEMMYLLRQFPNVREVEFWEDRKPDLKGYQRLGEKLGVRFTPKRVKNYDTETPPYLGVFLTPESRTELLKQFPPKHENSQADHVTLMFRPNEDDMEAFQKEFRLGQHVPLKAVGYAEDDKGQALIVELPPKLRSQARRSPHITLSLAPGVEPLYSNELIEDGYQELSPPRLLQGVIDGGPRHDSPDPPKQLGKGELKKKLWQEFLREETRNPEFGKGGRKERILRKTLYDAGGAGRRHVMREWGPYIQERRGRS